MKSEIKKRRKRERKHTTALQFRIGADEGKLLHSAARSNSLSFASWARDRLLRIARTELKERQNK